MAIKRIDWQRRLVFTVGGDFRLSPVRIQSSSLVIRFFRDFEKATIPSGKFGCIISVLLGFCSCGQVDRTNPIEFNEMILEAIQNQDTAYYSEFVAPLAREDFSFEEHGWDMKGEVCLLEATMDAHIGPRSQWVDGVAWSYEGKQYDVTAFFGGDDLHRVSYTIGRDSMGGAFNSRGGCYVKNISENYRNYISEPYSGSQDVEFTSLVFRFNSWQKSFENVSVRLKNISEHDFERIQFKLIIMNNGQQIVRTTVDEPARLFSYDEVDIPVRALSNYVVGKDVNKETISFTAYPLKLSPKPSFESLGDLKRFGYLNSPD